MECWPFPQEKSQRFVGLLIIPDKPVPLPSSSEARVFSFRRSSFTRQEVDKRPTMAGGNFMHRVVSYVVNELVVNGLANSPAFQRFAVRTSRKIEDISSMAVQKRQELAEQMKDLSKNFESSKFR